MFMLHAKFNAAPPFNRAPTMVFQVPLVTGVAQLLLRVVVAAREKKKKKKRERAGREKEEEKKLATATTMVKKNENKAVTTPMATPMAETKTEVATPAPDQRSSSSILGRGSHLEPTGGTPSAEVGEQGEREGTSIVFAGVQNLEIEV